jgi:hypothetical protein
MFTLLPQQYKSVIMKRYKKRLSVVSLVLLCTLIICGIGFFFPSLILMRSEASRLEGEFNTLQNLITSKNDEELSATLKNLENTTSLLKTEDEKPSEIILEIVKARETNSIEEFSLSIEGGGSIVSISGMSPSRKELLSFVKRLEAIPAVEKADLPISNLAKDLAIPFNLKIVLKK